MLRRYDYFSFTPPPPVSLFPSLPLSLSVSLWAGCGGASVSDLGEEWTGSRSPQNALCPPAEGSEATAARLSLRRLLAVAGHRGGGGGQGAGKKDGEEQMAKEGDDESLRMLGK